MQTIHLTDNESKVFYEVINSELRKVINEYDDDTGRTPSKKRIADGRHARSILEDKWAKTQPKVANSDFINLDNIKACDIDLTDEEVKYARKLLDKALMDYRKYIPADSPQAQNPTGMIATIIQQAKDIETVISKL